jgi:hypothetical protein
MITNLVGCLLSLVSSRKSICCSGYTESMKQAPREVGEVGTEANNIVPDNERMNLWIHACKRYDDCNRTAMEHMRHHFTVSCALESRRDLL